MSYKEELQFWLEDSYFDEEYKFRNCGKSRTMKRRQRIVSIRSWSSVQGDCGV